ncbi:MAG: MATE family efflux transporter [Spirochaetia bacterium]|nr:MATE family efflux transporter [Spirochaetia bacterium]
MQKQDIHDLTTGDIPQIIRRIAIPASIGTLFNTMYNIVDTFWAGRLSTESLAALSLNFPVFLVALAIGVGFSQGTSALISNYLGEKRPDQARKIFLQSIMISTIVQISVIIPMLLLLSPIFDLMGAAADVLPRALRYARVIISGSIFMTLTQVLNSSLTARGFTKIYRNMLIIGFFLNLALDPLLMFGFSIGSTVIIPEMQESGIALATVMIQALSACYIAYKAMRLGIFTGLQRSEWRPLRSRAQELASQVLPSMMSFLIMALGTFVITYFTAFYGTDALAAYGLAIRVEQIALVPSNGLTAALGAITGQNNGARRFDRIHESVAVALRYGFYLFLGLMLPVLIFGRSILSTATDNQQVLSLGYHYLLIQGITYYSYIILFQSNSILMGLKRPMMIMWAGLYRQILGPAIVFTFLTQVMGMGVYGIWWGLVIVNWSAAGITLYWSRRQLAIRRAEARL